MGKIYTPLKAIRARCVDCTGRYYSEITNCDIDDCPLWPYRMGEKPEGSCLKVIRQKCIWCCAGQPREATLCPAENCPLYPYRSGKNPKRKGVGNRKPESPSEGVTPPLS